MCMSAMCLSRPSGTAFQGIYNLKVVIIGDMLKQR